jgi:hypothetical protein
LPHHPLLIVRVIIRRLADSTVFQASHTVQGKHSGQKATFITCVSGCRIQAGLSAGQQRGRGSLPLRHMIQRGAASRRSTRALAHRPIVIRYVVAFCETRRLAENSRISETL